MCSHLVYRLFKFFAWYSYFRTFLKIIDIVCNKMFLFVFNIHFSQQNPCSSSAMTSRAVNLVNPCACAINLWRAVTSSTATGCAHYIFGHYCPHTCPRSTRNTGAEIDSGPLITTNHGFMHPFAKKNKKRYNSLSLKPVWKRQWPLTRYIFNND